MFIQLSILRIQWSALNKLTIQIVKNIVRMFTEVRLLKNLHIFRIVVTIVHFYY